MNTISPKAILRALLNRIWLIVGVAVVCSLITCLTCATLITPVYRATASIVVNNGGINSNAAMSQGDYNASVQMLATCVDILKTRNSYELLSNKLKYEDWNEKDYSDSVSVSVRSSNSLFIDISASHTDPKKAVEIANAFASLTPQTIESVFTTAKVTIAQSAVESTKISPRVALLTVSAFLIGAIAVVGVLIVIAVTDQTVKGEDDLTDNYNVPILGNVPDFDMASR